MLCCSRACWCGWCDSETVFCDGLQGCETGEQSLSEWGAGWTTGWHFGLYAVNQNEQKFVPSGSRAGRKSTRRENGIDYCRQRDIEQYHLVVLTKSGDEVLETAPAVLCKMRDNA